MATIKEFKKGMCLRVDGELFLVTEFQHVSPGNWRAFIRSKIKNLKTGKVIEKTFRTSDVVDEVRLDTLEMQYLYADKGQYYFMDNATYEQFPISQEVIGDAMKYLKENLGVKVTFHETTAISVEIPNTIVLKVVETEPGKKGDTINNATKLAKLETGAMVHVPIFINQGEAIKVDTRTDAYIERAGKP